MPSLLKKRVITSDEGSQLNDLKVEERAPRLVAMVSEKGMRSIVTFVECIKQSQEHEKLARLFMMATGEWGRERGGGRRERGRERGERKERGRVGGRERRREG